MQDPSPPPEIVELPEQALAAVAGGESNHVIAPVDDP